MPWYNPKWIADSHATWDYYEKLDNLPVNPPHPDLMEENMPNSIGILNWLGDDGNLMFVPRVRERNDWLDGGRAPGLERGFHAAGIDEAPELDYDSGYDCD